MKNGGVRDRKIRRGWTIFTNFPNETLAGVSSGLYASLKQVVNRREYRGM
jgi:hypothetical protein